MHEPNWEDLRYVLAVADTGSVAAAAKSLSVAHTTVLRRIASFEADSGARLFERTARGYRIVPDRAKSFEALRTAGTAIEAARAEIDASVVAPGEILRVTSTDMLCATFLPSVLQAMRRDNPGLQVALLSSNAYLDLAHGHADLTLRPALDLPADLLGDCVAHLGMSVYGTPGAPEEWLGVTGPLTRSVAGQWLRDKCAAPATVTDSFVVLAELLATGAGRSILPCLLGDADPRLHRLSGDAPILRVPLWVAGHRDLGDSRRIRRFRKALGKAISLQRAALLGDRSARPA